MSEQNRLRSMEVLAHVNAANAHNTKAENDKLLAINRQLVEALRKSNVVLGNLPFSVEVERQHEGNAAALAAAKELQDGTD